MMRFSFTLGLILVAVLALATEWPSAGQIASAEEKDGKAEAVKKELASLQGTWKLLTHEEDGKEVPEDEGQLYIIDKDKMSVKRKGEVFAEGSITLDPMKSPKQLDFKLTSGQTDLTVYIRVGDYLIQCGHRDGKTRPTEFATGTPKGGAYLIVLQRQK